MPYLGANLSFFIIICNISNVAECCDKTTFITQETYQVYNQGLKLQLGLQNVAEHSEPSNEDQDLIGMLIG